MILKPTLVMQSSLMFRITSPTPSFSKCLDRNGLIGRTRKRCLSPPERRQEQMDLRPSDKDRHDVESAIRAFFEAGKNKDLSSLADMHASRDLFTKFDENPPYSRQNSEEAFVYEQAAFANISDYAYTIDELRIDLLGDVAISTFYLTYSGMFVNDYSFEGSPVRSRTRATFVLIRAPRGWKMVHEHLSRVPDSSADNHAKS